MQELPALALSELRESLIVLVSSSDLISSDRWEKGKTQVTQKFCCFSFLVESFSDESRRWF